jgi:hypothetical protein
MLVLLYGLIFLFRLSESIETPNIERQKLRRFDLTGQQTLKFSKRELERILFTEYAAETSIFHQIIDSRSLDDDWEINGHNLLNLFPDVSKTSFFRLELMPRPYRHV